MSNRALVRKLEQLRAEQAEMEKRRSQDQRVNRRWVKAGVIFAGVSALPTGALASLHGLAISVAYATGVLLGVMGVMRLPDHVENPPQTQLSHGAIRLAAQGALFALPIIYDDMRETIETDGASAVTAAKIKRVDFTFVTPSRLSSPKLT